MEATPTQKQPPLGLWYAHARSCVGRRRRRKLGQAYSRQAGVRPRLESRPGVFDSKPVPSKTTPKPIVVVIVFVTVVIDVVVFVVIVPSQIVRARYLLTRRDPSRNSIFRFDRIQSFKEGTSNRPGGRLRKVSAIDLSYYLLYHFLR